ncbi:MAG: hypothetical protein QOE33_3434 [Acidobacteriota bacterium]|nr:hypothetical protein [Acidobacteriota bacterium]
MNDDDGLEQELREATQGLTFMSESDYPVEVVRWDKSTEPTPEFLRRLAGEDAQAPVETTTVEEFFRVAASETEWKGAAEIETARRYQKLVKLLEGLSDLTVYRVGTINIPVYVVGRSASGDWLGVATRVVET